MGVGISLASRHVKVVMICVVLPALNSERIL